MIKLDLLPSVRNSKVKAHTSVKTLKETYEKVSCATLAAQTVACPTTKKYLNKQVIKIINSHERLNYFF